MKIKISKSQWIEMGKTANWIRKVSSVETMMDTLYKDFQSPRSGFPIYVTLYEVSRNYGGPEEGGWWYDFFTLVKSKKFYDKEKAENFARQLNEQIKAGNINDDLSSAKGFDNYPDPSRGDPSYDHSDTDIPIGFSGDARKYVAYVEDRVGEFETKERPHYE